MVNVLLMAFGRRGYAYAAENLAKSLRYHTTEIRITLAADGVIDHIRDRSMFDNIHPLTVADVHGVSGKIDPANVKLMAYDIGTRYHDSFIYLDVDAIATKDITPLFEACQADGREYLTDVMGSGKRGDKINYDIWADHADTWPFYQLPEDGTFRSVQSSWCYIRKGAQAEAIFATARSFHALNFDLRKLKMKWGNTMPDELLMSAAMCYLDIDPTFNIRPIFFGNTNEGSPDNHYLLAIYGNGKGSRTLVKPKYIAMYEKLRLKYGCPHGVNYIMSDKHANAAI